jgi:hypothetical protein
MESVMTTDEKPEATDTTGSELIANVERMARLSDQMTDRQRLMKAVPSLVILLDDSTKALKPTTTQLDQALSQIWPSTKLINELDEDFGHHRFEDIKIFDIECEGFERKMKIAPDFILVKGAHEDKSTQSSEETDEFSAAEITTYTEDVFCLISPRVALKFQTVCEDYCDDDFDVILRGEFFLSENPRDMQALVRSEMKAMTDCEDLEEKLKSAFGSNYMAKDAEQAPTHKGPRP